MKVQITVTDTSPTTTPGPSVGAPAAVEYLFSVYLVQSMRESCRRRAAAAAANASRSLACGNGPLASRDSGSYEAFNTMSAVMSDILGDLRLRLSPKWARGLGKWRTRSTGALVFFLLGFGFCAALHATVQDTMGMDAWRGYCRRSWVDVQPWIPAAFAGLFASIAIFRARDMRKRWLETLVDVWADTADDEVEAMSESRRELVEALDDIASGKCPDARLRARDALAAAVTVPPCGI